MLGQAQSVTHEWVVTSQFHSTFPNASAPSGASAPFGPRHQFRSITTPPSYSPSPTPSVASSLYSADMVEIEELADDYSDDSGIELLQGEFEEAPENYGQKQEDEMDSEEDEQEVLQRLRRLIASQHVERNASSQASEAAAGRGSFITSALRKKRSFTESLDGSADDDESDNRTDSSSGGRIRRRKLVPMRPRQKRDTQDSSGRSTPDFMMEMDM